VPYFLTLPEVADTTIRERMLTLAENISSQYESLTYGDDIEIENIPHNSCDGFIAHTNGGYKISLVFDTASVISSGKYISQELREFCERLQNDAQANFISDNQKRLEIQGYSDDLSNFWDILEDNENIKEDFYSYEMEYISITYYVEIRAMFFAEDNYRCSDGYKGGEISFDLAVNLDEYGREKYGKNLAAVSLQIDGITADEINREVFDFFGAKV